MVTRKKSEKALETRKVKSPAKEGVVSKEDINKAVKAVKPKKATIASLTAEVEALNREVEYWKNLSEQLNDLVNLQEKDIQALTTQKANLLSQAELWKLEVAHLNSELSKPLYQRWYEKLLGK